MMVMEHSDAIRVVVIREDGQFVAQCLEYDIAAQADDLEILQVRLAMTLRAEQAARNGSGSSPFPGLKPAPPHFHSLWDKCEFRNEPKPVSGIDHGTSYRMAMGG